MPRVHYYNDPDAPKANSLAPSVSVAVRDADGRLLMVRQVDEDVWALPGGEMRPGESVADTAVREVAERSGVRVEITDLVGLYTSPGYVVAYDDGEVRQEFSVCFHGCPQRGEQAAAVDGAAWVAVAELDELPIHPATRTRINDALGDLARPRIL